MKLLLCRACGDVVKLQPTPRSCLCGASSGHYLEDLSTVEQTEGSISIALHNHDLRSAIEAFDASPDGWHPLMVLRAYVNPASEPDVRFVEATVTCGRCGVKYAERTNAGDACRYHPGELLDYERIGQPGAGASGDFWSCCMKQVGGPDDVIPGCAVGRHQPPASGASK